MRVAVDGRPLVKQATGVATCLRDTIKAICEYLPEWELYVIVPKSIDPSITDLPIDKVKVVVSPLTRFWDVPNFIWYHLKFPFIVRKLNVDLIWGTNTELPIIKFKNPKRMITICDVVWKEFQDTMNPMAKYINVPFLDRSVKDADYIYAISNYTKSKVDEYFPTQKCKNIFVGISCSTIFQKKAIGIQRKYELLAKYSMTDKFIIFVGSLEPRKNLSFLLELMPEVYLQTDAKLLVVGGKGWKNHDIHKLVDKNEQIRNSVVFANYVDFDELVDLYNIATCYVSTSLNEGFGLPQLEAMSCGCPVISPHNSAMIEVVEGRGVTVKGWDRQDWISVISRVFSDRKFRDSLCNPNLAKFDWGNIVKGLDKYIKQNMEHKLGE